MTTRIEPVAVPRSVPTLLGTVAGYVDSCTFLALFGLFVAQVTGSFVVAGAQLVTRDPEVFVKVLAIPLFFIAGVATTMIATIAGRTGRSPLGFALALECALLVGFLVALYAGFPFGGANAAPALLASLFGIAAMGAQSALVRLLMRGVASTNVMTTNTTQLAIDVADLVIAWRDRRAGVDAGAGMAAARAKCATLVPIVLGFLGGTLAGALAFMLIGPLCVVVAVAIVLALTIWAMRR
jgi:uncharacterized membrane protein YoaK (UPF0700 family)